MEQTLSNSSVLTERQAADYLNLTARALQAWRFRGCGPKFVRLSSRCIRYRREDLDLYLAERLANNTRERTAAEINAEAEASR